MSEFMVPDTKYGKDVVEDSVLRLKVRSGSAVPASRMIVTNDKGSELCRSW